MLISQSELFTSPNKISIELDSSTLANVKECNVITTQEVLPVCEYGENESFENVLGSSRHCLELCCPEAVNGTDLTQLSGVTVKIYMPGKTITFKNCKTYKSKLKISGSEQVVTEICMISTQKSVVGDDLLE